MASSFKINDYNLYLDLHPEDSTILVKFKEECERYERLSKEYEKKYGPLEIESADYNSFKWVDGPWPWEGDNIKYV